MDIKKNGTIIWELLKLCNSPFSTISPIPFFALALFFISQSGFNLYILILGITVSLTSNFGSNLWNHVNDTKEDILANKKTLLTENTYVRNISYMLSAILYLSSIIIVYYISMQYNRPIYLYFIVWAFMTWWYSDNLILKRIFGFRLKEHYLGELVTYIIAWFTYTATIWSIYSDLNINGIIVSVSFTAFGISIVLLKDLKDISGDKKAGLKTFGVVFPFSKLIKHSCYFTILQYLILLNPLSISIFGFGIMILFIPFGYFLYNIFIPIYKKNWNIDLKNINSIKRIGTSIIISIIFIGISGIFE